MKSKQTKKIARLPKESMGADKVFSNGDPSDSLRIEEESEGRG